MRPVSTFTFFKSHALTQSKTTALNIPLKHHKGNKIQDTITGLYKQIWRCGQSISIIVQQQDKTRPAGHSEQRPKPGTSSNTTLGRSKVLEITLLLVPAIKDFCTLSSFSATKTLKLIKVLANKAWFTVYEKMEKLLSLPLIMALFLMLEIPPPISCLRLMVTGYVPMSKCQ